jgi:hypothetical protein
MSWHYIKLVHRNGVEPFPLAFRGPRSALAAVFFATRPLYDNSWPLTTAYSLKNHLFS